MSVTRCITLRRPTMIHCDLLSIRCRSCESVWSVICTIFVCLSFRRVSRPTHSVRVCLYAIFTLFTLRTVSCSTTGARMHISPRARLLCAMHFHKYTLRARTHALHSACINTSMIMAPQRHLGDPPCRYAMSCMALPQTHLGGAPSRRRRRRLRRGSRHRIGRGRRNRRLAG